MDSRIPIEILPQPSETTCGPTCLHAIYRHYGSHLGLGEVISGVRQMEEGGTIAALLGCDALRRGFRSTIYTYNLEVFDPTWFGKDAPDLRQRLRAQAEAKNSPRLQSVTRAYLEFLDLKGQIRLVDLTRGLIRKYLDRGRPILTGLSAAFLYRCPREIGPENRPDDIRGEPSGHFVVLCGYNRKQRTVLVADPLRTNPYSPTHLYEVRIDRLVCSILLGTVTHDANFLVVEPRP